MIPVLTRAVMVPSARAMMRVARPSNQLKTLVRKSQKVILVSFESVLPEGLAYYQFSESVA